MKLFAQVHLVLLLHICVCYPVILVHSRLINAVLSISSPPSPAPEVTRNSLAPSPAPLVAPTSLPVSPKTPLILLPPSPSPTIASISLPPSPAPKLARILEPPSPASKTTRISSPPTPSPKASHIIMPPSLSPAPSLSFNIGQSNTAHIFDVKSFGAVGDGITDDTQAFKMAWDFACSNDSAIVHVPQHYTFLIQSTIFTGPCKSNLLFQVDGSIVPPEGPSSWPENINKKQWLVFYRVNGMSLQGGGLIDGRGEKWWSLPCKPHKGPHGTTLTGACNSPAAVRLYLSSNLIVKGLRIENSPQVHLQFDNCQRVLIDSTYVTAPSTSPNTDGIHLQNTNDVKIYNSVVSNGDDCVSIGPGCFNVDIRNITCGPSHGISIGSLGSQNSTACVSNINASDSVINNSENGVRIKTWQGGSGAVSKVNFNNIHMDNVRNPIIIDQYYCETKICPNRTSAVYITNIMYTNINGTYDMRSPPVSLDCSDSVPCTNLTLSGIELLPAQGNTVKIPFCWNAYGTMEMVPTPQVACLMKGNPFPLPDHVASQC